MWNIYLYFIILKLFTNFQNNFFLNRSFKFFLLIFLNGPSWSWSHVRWNYRYNQYLSPLKLYTWFPTRRRVLYKTLCDQCVLLYVVFFSRVLRFPSRIKAIATYDLAGILLKEALTNCKNKYLKRKYEGLIRNCVLKEHIQHTGQHIHDK
jgi:hypothetical protein